MEKRPEKHRLCHYLERPEIRRGDSGGLQKVGAKGENVEERMEMAKEVSSRSESQWNRGHFSVKEWESEKHKKAGA